jgi:hypothetical protein
VGRGERSARLARHPRKGARPEAPAYLDASAGGLVCTGCGGASYLLRPDLRKRARSALDGEDSALEVESAEAVLGWIDKALAAHAGLAPADAG